MKLKPTSQKKKITKEDREFWEKIKHLPALERATMASMKWGTGFSMISKTKNTGKGKKKVVYAVYPCIGCLPSSQRCFGNVCGHQKLTVRKAPLFTI